MIDLKDLEQQINFPTRFYAYATTRTTMPTGVSTLVPLDAVLFDSRGEFDTTNHRFKPTKPGYYVIAFQGALGSIDDGVKFAVGLRKNDTDTISMGRTIPGGDNIIALGNSCIVYLNGTTDYLTMEIYHTSAADKNMLEYASNVYYTFMAGHKIS